jgi:poly-gamma-glutamate capsule biosynthesis protein CapA/YwtB (metallophosphatase superfamily)
VMRLVLIACCLAVARTAPALEPLADVREAAAEQEIEPIAFTLAAVGDVMMHDLQVRSARGADGRYRIEDAFAPIADHIASADVAFANLEAPLAGEDMAYAGYPTFNAPRALARALVHAGFDVVQTANNHCMDRREKGLLRTIEALDAEGLLHVGTRADPAEAPALWLEIAGVPTAWLAYTFSTNGIPLPPGREAIVGHLDGEQMLADIAAVRDQGAELVVIGCHWGIEYRHEPEAETVTLAQELIEGGADVILGGHPHYVQPYEVVTAEDGREGFVVYSLGNFLSNMRKRYQDAGMILRLTFETAPGAGVALADVGYVSTWVDTSDETGAVHHQVVDVNASLPECGRSPRLDASDCAAMTEAQGDTRQVLGAGDEIVPEPPAAFTDPSTVEEVPEP